MRLRPRRPPFYREPDEDSRCNGVRNGNKKSQNILLPHRIHKHEVTVSVTSQALESSRASWRVQVTRRE